MRKRMRTILFLNSGPMINYEPETLYISDLNPEVNIKWHLSRWELVVVGLRCIWAALQRP